MRFEMFGTVSNLGPQLKIPRRKYLSLPNETYIYLTGTLFCVERQFFGLNAPSATEASSKTPTGAQNFLRKKGYRAKGDPTAARPSLQNVDSWYILNGSNVAWASDDLGNGPAWEWTPLLHSQSLAYPCATVENSSVLFLKCEHFPEK